MTQYSSLYLTATTRMPTRPVFLQKRCAPGVTRPGGFVAIGSFDAAPNGQWQARIAIPFDVATDSDAKVLGVFDSRLSAIAYLWRGRHEAYCPF